MSAHLPDRTAHIALIGEQLKALPFRELLDLFNDVLEARDDASDFRRSGVRLAEFVHYKDEPVLQNLVAVADWRQVDSEARDRFVAHFSERLVQSGTCDVCRVEVISYSKSAKCPVCAAYVECT